MSATKPTPANAPIEQQFDARGNVVEGRTLFKSAAAFASASTRARDIQATTTRYMCEAERLAYIKRGVVFHDVFAGPGDAKPFEFTIDERACASLAAAVPFDAESRRRAASAIADSLTTTLSKAQPFPGSRFGTVGVRDGVIDVTNVIVAPAFADVFKYKAVEVMGRTQGLLCGTFGDAIRRGVRIRVVYEVEGGAPVLEFPVDGSVC